MISSAGLLAPTPAAMWFFFILSTAIGALYFHVPAARRRLAAAGAMAAAAATGLILTGFIRHQGFSPQAALYRALNGTSLMLLAVSVINASGALVFDLILLRIGLRLPGLIRDMAVATAYLLASFIVLSQAGVNITGIVATSAVVTAVIAFSLQDTLGNLIGGMVLHLESSLAPGDWIRTMSGEEGRVREIRWRQTAIETSHGDTIVIPNSELMKSRVTIIGRRAGLPKQSLRAVSFNVYYDRSPNAVIDAVEQALRADPPPHVLKQPPPECLLSEFKQNHAVYALCYWLDDISICARTDSVVRARVYYALSRSGIKISVPNRSVVVTQGAEEALDKGRAQELKRRETALRGTELFTSLNAEELNLLAGRLKNAPFTRGEAITRQGAKANWLYIIAAGHAEVSLAARNGEASRAVAELKPGEFMGEMGLLTGEPRAATVTALSDVQCYRLDRESLADIMAGRPQIAEHISTVLARRSVELEAAQKGLKQEAQRLLLAQTQGDLLSRIRGLFRLRES